MSASSRRDRLVQLMQPVVSRAGFDLEDVVVTLAGRRRLLRIVVDADDGVSLDDTTTISHSVSEVLDESDAMGGQPYVLEVTSPGVDRPLSSSRHWRRARGRLVRVPLSAGGEVRGRIVDADEGAVVLDIDGDTRAFRYAELGRGKVQVEFRDDNVRGEG